MDGVLFRVALRFHRQAQGRLTNRGFGPIIEVKVMLNDPFQLVLALILVIIIEIFEELK
jgi:hypothetical protein